MTTLGTASPLNVLLIEDDPDDAELLTELLSRPGTEPIELTWARTLDEGVAHLDPGGFDIVLLDLGLTETKGLATLETFQAATPRGIPVVVLTGLDDAEVAEAALHAGAQDYLVKGQTGPMSVLRAIRFAQARRREQEGYEAVVRQEAEVQRLEEQASFQRRFLNLSAHELATPLTPIMFQLATLRSEGAGTLTPVQHQAVDVLDRNVQRLSRIIADLLQATRLQADEPLMRVSEVDLRELVQDVATDFQALAQENGLGITLENEGDLGMMGDSDRLKQAVSNLVENAVVYGGDGGQVHLVVRQEGEQVLLEVRDQGRGIAPEDLEGLFEPFPELHEVREDSGLVTGMGLFITRSIVERHGGTIQALSPGLGQGTTIIVELPRRPPRSGAPPGERSAAEP